MEMKEEKIVAGNRLGNHCRNCRERLSWKMSLATHPMVCRSASFDSLLETDSDSIGVGWGLGLCISQKFLSDASAAGL